MEALLLLWRVLAALMHQSKEACRKLFDAESWSQALPGFLDWIKEAQSLYPNAVTTMRQ